VQALIGEFADILQFILYLSLNTGMCNTIMGFFLYSLQTGMRGAFGKPNGLVARVHIGQPIISIRSTDKHKAHVVEALRRAKFKFPGRQKVRLST